MAERHQARDGAPLGRLLGSVERQVARALEATLTPAGLTVDQWRVVDLLSDGEGHPMSEIAGAIVVPGPTLTKLVDRLVDVATVYRLVDARDRRRVLAFLSEGGRALHEQLEPQVQAVEADALAVLGDDIPVLLALLARLAGGRRAVADDGVRPDPPVPTRTTGVRPPG